LSDVAAHSAQARFHVGTQGWNYDFWSERFYPRGVKSADRLELYSRIFDSVEIDSTFYAMPPVGRFRSWYERTPPDFTFTAKLPRDITHDARLVGVDDTLLEFCGRAAELEEKLGVLLVQLPPDMSPHERSAVDAFVRSLPRELEFAVEFRDARWFDEQTFAMLHDLDVALALSVGPWLSSAEAMRIVPHAPGRIQYLRWMGAPRHQELTPELVRERDADLAQWAERILGNLTDRPVVYAYFNNDYQGHSPDSARRLQSLLGMKPSDPALLQEQPDLFG
jgi:uncharacterized protein YecE (DUF72 family)